MAHKRLKQQSFHDSPLAQSRFITLPVELKLKVLEHFSFEEAARTGILSSILSSTNSWSEHSQVILDKLLFEERGRWISLHPTAWVRKVAEILNNHHKGRIPIRKFVVHIPDMQFKWATFINIWISSLSCNGIKDLSVDNWNIITHHLSSFLFNCNELTRLMLRNCAFGKSSGVFQNLRFLRFEKMAFDPVKVGDLRLSTPLLVKAELVDCTGIQYFTIHAPELQRFFVAGSEEISGDDVQQMTGLWGITTMGWAKQGYMNLLELER